MNTPSDALPEPQTELFNPITGLPQFSEAETLKYVHHYSEEIGYRIIGTPEMDRAIDYTLQVANQLKAQAANNGIEIEVSRQRGDGHHLFDFMGKVRRHQSYTCVVRNVSDPLWLGPCALLSLDFGCSRSPDHLFQKVWKKYLGIENVVVRLSNGTQAGKENAILLNAHVDSTLPSPGAADDASGVAVMLESIRVLSQTPDLKLNTALVFLFNGAEESLQDASHLFITQHPWRHTYVVRIIKTVSRQSPCSDIDDLRFLFRLRAVINLEACGGKGPETLFQSTSSEVCEDDPFEMGTSAE